MAGFPVFSLTLRLGGALAAGSIAVAGCASAGSSSASSAVSPSASSPSASSPSGTAPATPVPSTSAATGSGSGSASGAGGGVAGCVTKDLRAKLVNGQGAAGSLFENIDLTNTGSTACSLYGYPGVSIGTGMPFKQVGAAAVRSTQASPAEVTLAPGQTANSLLRIVEALNYPKATCSPTAVTYLQVYPPNQTTALYLPVKATGCASTSVKLLTIGVVQAGPVTTS